MRARQGHTSDFQQQVGNVIMIPPFFFFTYYTLFFLSLSRALCFSVLRFSFSCHRHRSEGKVIKNEEKKTISIER